MPVSVAVFSFLPLPALGHTDRAGVGQGCLVLSARLAGDSLWILPLWHWQWARLSSQRHRRLPVLRVIRGCQCPRTSSNQTSIIKFMRDELPA